LLGIFYLGGTIEHVRKVTLNNIFLTASVLGALFAAYFLYIQFFILKRICISCLTIDGIMLIVFFVSLTDFILDLNKNNY
ncbi:MAG: vitamin K epoxide reductase family protein, partial [Nanoarchaeota archaeon]|nr:vitamin K epoxide reductase family protein [Nanoarchaeota archaeon]